MHIRCPHCHNAIEVVEDSSFRDVSCPSCGSHFNLVGGDELTEASPTKPRQVGHFELIEQLGVGNFGTVWKAKDTTLDRFVAVKIPRGDQLTEADVEKFFREARAAAQLHHPNIVSVHEVGRDGNTIFIASDYVEGATLKEWLGGQPLAPREAAKLCAKLADALDSAHEAGVVHRDLKPGNIMMDMHDEPHIMDFGLAKRDSGEFTMTMDGALLGTPAYMSPEQAAGRGHEADRRADVYSLGVILFEMLTGEVPFRGEKRMLLVQIQRDEPPSPRKLNANIPRDLETICLKCLEKSPERRYQSARAVLEELTRFLNGEAIIARAIGRAARAWRWSKRNPSAAILPSLLLVIAVVGPVTSLWLAALWRGLQQSVSDRINAQVASLLNADIQSVPVILKDLAKDQDSVIPQLEELQAKGELSDDQRLRIRLALVQSDESIAAELVDQLLTTHVVNVPVIATALKPHRDKISEKLWQVLHDKSQPEERRFRVGAALASVDGDSSWWSDEDNELIARQLVAVNPAFIGQWQDVLRPIADRLVPPLTKIFVDPQQGELPRSLATSLLADYARDNVQTLTNLVIDADTKAFAELLPVLKKHGHEAVAQLQTVLARKVEPTWKDSPLDPTWKEVTPEVRVAIEAAHGMLAERFAFCQGMPWDEFTGVREALEASGYWPTRVRPWLSGDQRLVAAVWTRDGQRRELQTDLSKDQLPAPDVPAEKDGLLPADIAVVPSTGPSVAPQFVLLWGPPITEGEQRRMIVDASEKELTDAQDSLAKQDFAAQNTVGVWIDAARQRHYVGIWSNKGAPSELRAAYAGFELVHEPQWDVAVAPAGKLADPLDAYREQLVQIAALPAAQTDQPQPRLLRAQAQYHLGQLEPALADLDFLVEKQAISTAVLQYRAWTLARLGKVDEAHAALTTYSEQDNDPSTRSYVQIVLEAWLGKLDEVTQQLDALVTASTQNADSLYNAACAAALASQACAQSDTARSQQFADRAIELLGTAIAHGYENARQVRTDIDLARLHGDPRFLALLEQLAPPARYAAVWRADVEFESRLTTLQSPESLLAQAGDLAAQGFRPVAIAVTESPGDATTGSSPPASSLPPEASVIWHRPLVPDDKKEELAVRQASAAVALLGLQQADQVWPLLRHQPDPRLRSYLLDRLASYGADPESLWQRLTVEKDDSTRRALILGLGDFADAKLLSAAEQPKISAELLRLYQEDPDPGIHAAAEWTLKQLGKKAEVTTVRSALSTSELLGQRRWYVTKQGQHTMVILKPQELFLMGSPVSEAERYEGPTGRNEIRHQQSIGRTFAIAAHEVTVVQFLAVPFLADHVYSRQYSREPDSPVNTVTWYQAAQYCNWLSKQEGIPEDQWCYDPQQAFADGMRLYPDYLRRTGYRLPTEAEWEFACRAEATAARYYGEREKLLGQYAWYTKTSQDRWMLPVGSLRPNDFGLFDLLGNAFEWCQDRAAYYPTDRLFVEDAEQPGVVRDNEGRVLRGGSFDLYAPIVRSAYRNSNQPVYRNVTTGFRVARTYP